MIPLLLGSRPSLEPASQDQPGPRLKQLSLEELANVEVVSVAKAPETMRVSPAAIYVLTRDDIRRSGATSLPEVLRLVPGVEVARIDSNKWAVGIRGFGTRLSKSLLVLIDGRSVYTTLFAGVYWDAQDTLLEDIERIEVIRGPGGTIWGPNAVNGVINVITRHSRETRGLLASVSAGNVDHVIAGARFGAGSGDVSFRVYGKGFSRGPEFHADGNDFDDWRMARAGFRMDGSANTGRDEWTFQGDLYAGAAGNRLAVSYYSPPRIVNEQGDTETAGGNLLGRWQRRLGVDSHIRFLAYYDRASRTDLNFAEDRDTFDLDFTHDFVLAGNHHLTWGLGSRFAVSRPEEVVPTVTWVPNDFTDQIYTSFLQDAVTLAPDLLTLTLGAKIFHNNYTGFEVQPTARLLWTPQPLQSFWLGVTRAVRTPSRVDEHLRFTAFFFPDLPGFVRLVGDGGFTSESMLGLEGGYRGMLGRDLFVDVAVFHNDYDDLLSVEAGGFVLESEPPPAHLVLPLSFRNGIRGTSSGIEIAPIWTVTDWLRVKGSYSFLDLDMENAPESVDASTATQIEGSSPRHQIVLQSLWDLPGTVEIDATYRYVSDLPYRMADAYHTADVGASWSPSERLRLGFFGRNLLDANHVEFTSDPGPNVGVRRSFRVNLTFRN